MRKDWISLWFVIQNLRGHSDRVPMYFYNLKTKEVKDFSFHHREMDGMAVFTKALRSLGIESPKGSRPLKKPAWWKRPMLLLKGLLGQGEMPRPPWKRLNPDDKEKGEGISFLVLEQEANEELKSFLKAQNVSMNAYLIKKISQVIEEFLFTDGVDWKAQWLLPVDMRGAFSWSHEVGNCVSYLPVLVSRDSSLKEIFEKIRWAFRKDMHWSNWWAYHIGKVVGFEMMKRISEKVSQKNFWMGSLTDLGDWTPENDKYKDWAWGVAAPGTPNNPVGSASLEWFGRRTISLRVHPSVRPDAITAWDLVMLERLSQIISRDLGRETSLFTVITV